MKKKWELGLLDEYRKKLNDDLFMFSRVVLGYDLYKIHYQLCRFLQENEGDDKLVLLPRKHYKTTLISVAQSLWWICKNRNVKILIAQGTYEKAVKTMRTIQMHCLRNKMLKRLYPGLFGNKKNEYPKFTENEILVERDSMEGASTIFIATPESNVVGEHVNKIVVDDVVHLLNVKTKHQIMKIIDWFYLLYPIITRDEEGLPGDIDVVGTRWAYDDLYGHLIEYQKDNYKMFISGLYYNKKTEIGLKRDNSLEGKPIFPEKFTEKIIKELKSKMTTYDFSHQYLNEPIDKETAPFNSEMIVFYEPEELRDKVKKGDYINFTIVDPAHTTTITSDFTAIINLTLTSDGTLYVMDYVNKRMLPRAVVSSILLMASSHNSEYIGIETFAAQKLYLTLLEDAMLEINMDTIIHEFPRNTSRSKHARIMRLEYFFRLGRIKIRKEMKALYDQIVRYQPGSNMHDDLIDALAYTLDMPFSLERQEQTKIKIYDPYKPASAWTGI